VNDKAVTSSHVLKILSGDIKMVQNGTVEKVEKVEERSSGWFIRLSVFSEIEIEI
jgi:hypothetical protein